MFCHEDPGDTVRYVMGCHVLHACSACPTAGSGMRRSFRAEGPGIPFRFPGFASSAWVDPFNPVPFRSSRRPALRSGGALIRAYPARAPAPACARFAAARIACLIARTHPRVRANGRMHFARWLNQDFSRRREGNRPPDAASFLPPHLSIRAHGINLIREIIQILWTNCNLDHRSGPRPRSAFASKAS